MRSLFQNNIVRCRLFFGLMIVSLLLPLWVQAQKKTLAIQVSPELISKTVTRAILEDSYGFLWHGGGGLFKYDGFESKVCRPESADSAKLSLGTVQAILEEKNGDLLIGSSAGLFRYERQSDKIMPLYSGKFVKQTGGVSTVYSLYQDAAGRIWIGTETNLYVVRNPGAQPVKVFDNQDFALRGQIFTGVYSIAEDKRGNIYAASSHGLWRVERDLSFRQFAPDAGTKGGSLGFRITDAATNDGDTLWLTTLTGLWIFDTRNERFYPISLPGVSGKRFTELAFDRQKRLYIAVSGQIWERSPGGSMSPISGPPATFFHTVSILTTDRFGNLWAGGFNGLVKIELAANRALPFYQVIGDMPDQDNACLRLMQDSSGGFWFRMINSGLGYCAELGGVFEIVLQPPLDVATEEIKNFCTDADGNVWVLTLTNGLYRFPKGAKRWQHVLADDSMRVAVGHSILYDQKDKRLLWFSSNFGLCSVDRFTLQKRWFHPKKDLPWLDVESLGFIEQADDGNIWGATLANDRTVVICLDRTSGKFVGEYDPAKRPDFRGERHLKRVSKDTIWLATPAGALVIDTRRKTQFLWNRANGFPVKGLDAIALDARGNIWFTTGKKFCRYDGRSFGLFNSRKESDGLFYANATRARDGRLVFGGKSGIHVFDPEKIRNDTIRPRVYLTGFKVLNKVHGLGKALELVQEIRLPFESKVLTFEFAAVHFLHPNDVKYRHKLEGFEPDWVETGSRERWATYTNLSPDTYTFKVLAANSDGFWTNEREGLSIKLVILPPWYRTWWAYLLYALAIGTVLFGIRSYDLKRQLAKAEASRLQELDAVKNRLYTNITHEFRTPLTVILGEAAQLEKQAGKNQKGGLAAIRRQGRQLLHLVNQMLDLAKVEAGSLRVNMVQGNVVLFLKYLLESFHSLAKSKHIELRFETDTKDFWMDYDPDKLQKIASNLLSNAIKFTPSGGKVVLQVVTTSEGFEPLPTLRTLRPLPTLKITVSDTGVGIAPEELPRVFDRFYQADDSATRQAEGTGIGLTLTKELVHLLGGQISVESRIGEGSTFTVTLPVARTAERQQFDAENYFAENQEVKSESEASAVPVSQIQISNFKQNRPRLLLVEDNADVVRYISSLFAADYHIYKAGNGKEGVAAAFRLVPDIVISDVMMPEMDGFELCRILKTDERTSHIPIILLTAKADHASKIEGLTQGADVYLPKPFDPEELSVRLEKLHELRQRLQERLSGSGKFVDKFEPSDLEERFLQKAVRIVESKMSDEDFDMPQLCKALNMSRSNLFRKLKALTGKSATDFIRSLRLEKARELLETTDLNVTEVCFKVGFGSPNYFSRAFQEAFGVSPSEVRKG
ncbi:MAG TPA: ATP-binding protein [Saprospiraceae bacterium]|nr:ATP-binding protein [Saprospiraceae bacterium]